MKKLLVIAILAATVVGACGGKNKKANAPDTKSGSAAMGGSGYGGAGSGSGSGSAAPAAGY